MCDQPHAPAEVISGLVAAHRTAGIPITASAYGGGLGVPAVFDRALFAELRRLEGTSGAKELIRRYALAAHTIPFPGGEVDVDTSEDYVRLSAENGVNRTPRPAR